MSASLRAALCLIFTVAALAVGQTGPVPPAASAPRDEMKLPNDAVLVLPDKAADILRALPRFYLLAPDRYNALLADIDRLNKQLNANQPLPVNAWHVSGKVKGAVVELKASFSITTPRARAAVALGCSRAQPTAVTLDDQASPPQIGTEGVTIEVEKAGLQHKATIDMLLLLKEIAPAAPRTGAPAEPLQGFELDLPQTSVTTIDLELPPGVKAVEVNDQPLDATLPFKNNRLTGPPWPRKGLNKGLKLSWKAPQSLSAPQALLTSRGRIDVKLEKGQVISDARLTLQDLGRATREWRLEVPEGAQVSLANPSDRERLSADLPETAANGRVDIRLVEPSAEPLAVLIGVRQPRGSGPIPIGPFAASGAATQSGVLWVIADSDQRVRCKPHPSRPAFAVTPRGLQDRGKPEEAAPAGAVAGCQYWPQSGAAPGGPRDAWFHLDADTIQGQLDVSVTHTLRLGPESMADWRLTTDLDVTPLRAEVEKLDLSWPAPWELDSERGPRAKGARAEFKEKLSAGGGLRFRIDTDALKEFTLTLESQPSEANLRTNPLPAVPGFGPTSATVELPQPRETRNRGKHQVIVAVPEGADLDLRVPQPPNPGLELEQQEVRRLVWRAEKFPSQIALAWKPYRAEILAEKNVADVTLTAREARVEHRFHLVFEEAKRIPDAVVLRVPAEVKWLRRVIDGKKEEDLLNGAEAPRGGAERLVRCPLAPAPEEKGASGKPPAGRLVLRYAAPLPGARDGGEPLQRLAPVPLVAAAAATQGHIRVRVWAEPNSRLRAVQDAWTEASLEIVPERDQLPSLVLTGQRPAPPLTLQVASDGRPAQAAAVLERVLLQVRVQDNGFQQHRARFLVRQFGGPQLDLAFPVPVMPDLLVTLNERKVNFEQGPEPSIARLSVPAELLARPAVLEVTYQMASAGGGIVGDLQSILQPVTVPGLAAGVPVRWQVDLPPSWVVLPLDGDTAWRWGRRGWLVSARPSVSNADLERWFWGEGDARASALSEEEGALTPSHVCWRAGLGPLPLVHVPQQAWLLFCSLLVLVIGLALGQAALGSPKGEGRGRLIWIVLGILALGAGAVGLIWPGVMTAVIYGGQPGLAVLLVVLTVQWLLHERYRRRIVFLPSFRRVKTGSSLTRAARPEGALPAAGQEVRAPGTKSSNRGRAARTEPSTVDAPLPPPPPQT